MSKKIVPIKNVGRVLVDIRKPNFNYEHLVFHGHVDLRRSLQKPGRKNRIANFLLLGVTTLSVATLIYIGAGFYLDISASKNFLKREGATIGKNFSAAFKALEEFEPERAVDQLRENASQIASLEKILGKYRGEEIAQAVSTVIPSLKKVGRLTGTIAQINSDFLRLALAIQEFKTSGLNYFLNDGGKLLKVFKEVGSSMENLATQSQALKNITGNLKNFSNFFRELDNLLAGVYLKHSADLYKFESAFKGLANLISSGNERHFLIFFQNPAEIRPAGGFIGSYADLSVRNGQMTNLDVRDIYDPDGQFFRKIVPPEPLQGIVTGWAARDANWFFDFPLSAKAVINFLETSRMYSERGTVFDGAIALNINVLEDIVDIVGPIDLPGYKLTLQKENFLKEIQREVESGNDKKEGQPKRILQVLTPIIFERLKEMEDPARDKIFNVLRDRIAKKDIMFYLKDNSLASFLKEANLDGAVYELPADFLGAYLAVVNANVAGGKSDAFVYQSIDARINIDSDGGILTDLVVKREHRGNKEKESWWRAANKDYMQIITNPGSSLLSVSGNQTKKILSRFNYQDNGYEFYTELDKIELSKKFLGNLNSWVMEAFGKTIFATWVTTQAGKSSSLNFRYQTPDTGKTELAPGKKIYFIFDKQSGVKTSLKANIAAPLGFTWAESGEPNFVYENNDPDGRIIVGLTLAK